MRCKTILSTLLALAVAMTLLYLLPVHGESEVYGKVIRLHVIANSDTEVDQALKLQVRDAVLSVTVPLLGDCSSREEAKAILEANKDAILDAAHGVIKKTGRQDAVTLEFDEEQYPERQYDTLCFPSGEYLSMRVSIGEAQGQNFWCCLYPPLCLESATVSSGQAEDAFISVGLTPDQYKIITETERPVYKARFKILEVIRHRWK